MYEIVTRVPIPASEVCQEVELIKQSCSSLGPREAQKHTRLTVVRLKNDGPTECLEGEAFSGFGCVKLIFFFLIKM